MPDLSHLKARTTPVGKIHGVIEYLETLEPGGGGSTGVTAANITDATAVGRQVITAANPAAVRTAIGAGTSNLAIGTTNTTAKAGDYAPPNAAPAVRGLVLQAAASPDTAATDVAGVLAELRDLKAKLKAAGILA
jgi:hypothetical protein